MTDAALRAFCASGKLQQLDLSLRGATLTNDGLKEIGKLASLNRLDISHATALTAEGYEYLSGLKNLRELTLAFAGVDNRVMAALGKIKSLQEIWIYGAEAITDEGLMYMSGLPDLDYLNIDSNNTTEEGWKALRDKMPGKWRQGSAFQ